MTTYGTRLQTSCKECRRLKLKCDKKVPCSSCVRRGCASICPTGQMVSKGSRFILADTEELHQKIDILIARIHSLEDALEASYAFQTSESHPLLRQELRLLAAPLGSAAPRPDAVSKEEELVDSFGTLTLSGQGSRYFGSDTVAPLWNDGGLEGGSGDPDENTTKYREGLPRALAGLPLELVHMAHAFPIRIPENENVQQLGTWILKNCLPSYAEAWSLFENYWEHYAWHSTPFSRTTFVEQILSPFYHKDPESSDKPLGHRLALLFSVFAIGQFMDLTKPLDMTNGQRYYMLSRASLCLDPVFENPTITALQAMFLLGIYMAMARGAYKPEHGWILSGINVKLALALGLQHDPKKFGLPPAEVEARSWIATAVFIYEIFQSLIVGRLSSCTFSNFDWIILRAQDNPIEDPSSISPNWPPSFVRDCICPVMEAARETKYSAILKIDAMIRQYPVTYPSNLVGREGGEPQNLASPMQKSNIPVMKDVALLFLHRRFFALALAHSPSDPLKSPFAHSVLACYRSSVSFLAKVRTLYAMSRHLVERLWFFWPNVFVSTLILGSIVARSPSCSLASSAFVELEMVCHLWESASPCICGPNILKTVSKLRQKAFTAFSRHENSSLPFDGPSSGVEVDDEIAALGGKGPRVVSSIKGTTRSSVQPFAEIDAATRGVIAPTEPTNCPTTLSFQDLADKSTYSSLQPPEYPIIDLPDRFSNFPSDILTAEFEDMFQDLNASVSTQVHGVGPSVLEELGLSGGWQPVMDDLGL